MTSRGRVLITEPEPKFGASIVSGLVQMGYKAVWKQHPGKVASDIRSGRLTAAVVNLQLGWSSVTGFSILEKVRGVSEIPILVVSEELEHETLARLVQYPVADVIKKPYTVAELMFRLGRVSRHNERGSSALSQKELNEGLREARFQGTLLFSDHDIVYGETRVGLSAAERGILEVLREHRGEYVDRDVVVAAAEGGITHSPTWFSTTLHRLRKKLRNHNIPLNIHLRKGVGLKLQKKKNK